MISSLLLHANYWDQGVGLSIGEASARSPQAYVSLGRAKEGLKKQIQARTKERRDKVLQSRQSVMVLVLSPSDSEARVTSKLWFLLAFLLNLFSSLLAHSTCFSLSHTICFLSCWLFSGGKDCLLCHLELQRHTGPHPYIFGCHNNLSINRKRGS